MSRFWPAAADHAARLFARIMPLSPRVAARQAPPDATAFHPYDWQALVTRFVTEDGVDYATFARVRRILEVHLDRLSEARPDALASNEERLAFYLNAYNAIAIYQVLLHYPVQSILEIPAAFTRPFPVGHENLSLSNLLHSRIRSFRDPRIHAAVVNPAMSAPRLRTYTAAGLHQELDDQLRDVLADTAHGMRPMPHGTGVILNANFRRYAGDFLSTYGVRRQLQGMIRPHTLLISLARHAPSALKPLMTRHDAQIAFLTYDWRLNDTAQDTR